MKRSKHEQLYVVSQLVDPKFESLRVDQLRTWQPFHRVIDSKVEMVQISTSTVVSTSSWLSIVA